MKLHEAEEFADEWIAAWNAHNLDRILSHYSDDIMLSSDLVPLVTGSRECSVIGKQALRSYWEQGLSRYPDLAFQLERVFPGAQSLVIVYRSVDGLLAAEFMDLNDSGKVREVHAHYLPMFPA